MKIDKFVKIAQDYRDSHIDEIEMKDGFKALLTKKVTKRGRKSILSGKQ